MAGAADEHERTMAFAEIALGQIKALRAAATPRNYEIWYAYATGYQPSLNQKINETLKEHGKLSDADLELIYETFLSPLRLSERIDTVGSQVKGEIDQVMAMIEAAAGSANTYTESLANVSQKLGQSKDREGLRAIVESLVHTAKEMQVSNQRLEERLNASKLEIDELQNNLEAVRTESLTDPLTQLANRKFFDSTLEAAVADARARNEPLSLMMTDIDLQEVQRQLRPPHRRSSAAAGGDLGKAERQGPGHRRALWRRGIRHHPAEYGASFCYHRRRPHTPGRHDERADEALDRRTSRPRDHLGRRRYLAQGRLAADAD